MRDSWGARCSCAPFLASQNLPTHPRHIWASHFSWSPFGTLFPLHPWHYPPFCSLSTETLVARGCLSTQRLLLMSRALTRLLLSLQHATPTTNDNVTPCLALLALRSEGGRPRCIRGLLSGRSCGPSGAAHATLTRPEFPIRMVYTTIKNT